MAWDLAQLEQRSTRSVKEYSEEEGKFLTYEADRLGHALDADPSVSFTAFETVTVGTQLGGKVIEHTEERAYGTLPPRVLTKLRSKAIFSIREELAMIGEVELADHIIFNGEKNGH